MSTLYQQPAVLRPPVVDRAYSWRDSFNSGRIGRRLAAGGLRCRIRKALDVDDELQQLFLADLPLESGHHVALIAGHDLRIGIENGFTKISLVGDHRSAVVKLHGVPENIAQRWTAPFLIEDVARDAAVLFKQLFTLLGHAAAGGTSREPGLVGGRFHHRYPASHPRMVRSAVFSAKQVIAAG